MIKVAVLDYCMNLCGCLNGTLTNCEWLEHICAGYRGFAKEQITYILSQGYPNYCKVFLNPNFNDLVNYDILIIVDIKIRDLIESDICQNIIDKFIYFCVLEPTDIWASLFHADYKKLLESMKFTQIYTYHSETLAEYRNTFLMPFGGTFINYYYARIYNKTKNISAILTDNVFLEGHRLRLACAEKYGEYIEGRYGKLYNNHIYNKIDGLRDYRFSLNAENVFMPNYFSEKIIDCFLTGTIPIYCGPPNIGDFFDMDGIMYYTNPEECEQHMKNATEEYYLSKMPAIIKNYNIAKYYANYFGNVINLSVQDAMARGLMPNKG